MPSGSSVTVQVQRMSFVLPCKRDSEPRFWNLQHTRGKEKQHYACVGLFKPGSVLAICQSPLHFELGRAWEPRPQQQLLRAGFCNGYCSTALHIRYSLACRLGTELLHDGGFDIGCDDRRPLELVAQTYQFQTDSAYAKIADWHRLFSFLSPSTRRSAWLPLK